MGSIEMDIIDSTVANGIEGVLSTTRQNITFIEYCDGFKSMLVKRYNWKVADANVFDVQKIQGCFERGLSKYEAYCEFSGSDADLTGSKTYLATN